MCKTCEFIDSVFILAEKDVHSNYVPVLNMLFEIEKQKRIALFAGDCLQDQILIANIDEMHLTLCHYFKSSTCKRYFFVGSFIRGTPTFKSLDTLKSENLDKRIWGKFGEFFKDKA